MAKRKDYFTAIVMGTLWTLVCLGLSWGMWAIVKIGSSDNRSAFVMACLSFIVGIYKGRDFFKVEMVTVKKNDPKTNWLGFLDNLQLLCIAVVMVNSVNVFNDGFSWAGLGAFISGLAFVALTLYLKNTRFPK